MTRGRQQATECRFELPVTELVPNRNAPHYILKYVQRVSVPCRFLARGFHPLPVLFLARELEDRFIFAGKSS